MKSEKSDYDTFAQEYIKAQDAFYAANKDRSREFINSVLTKRFSGKEIKPGEEIKLLDAGCGYGLDLDSYVRAGFAGVGIELSKEMIAEGERRFPGLSMFQGDIRNTHFPEKSFDVITARFSMHYTENVDEVYKEFNRILAPNGLFVTIVPHPVNDLARKVEKSYQKRENVTVPLYDNKVSVTYPTHTFSDWFSPYFLQHFRLNEFLECYEGNDMPTTGIISPGFMGFAARKR